MALLLNAQSIGKSYAARTLFSNVSISVAEGERVGLIGANGSGKSTLLRILAGLDRPDEGEVTMRRGLRLGFVPQEDLFPPETSVEQVLVEALAKSPLDEIKRLAQARIMLGKLGFADAQQLAQSLSGGWKRRLSLARELIKEPELLLLDEPTNHLDLEGILYIEKLLSGGSIAFLMVSHDRYLLENAATRIVEFSPAYPEGSFSIDGPYSTFLEKRQEYLASQASERESLQSRLVREAEWLKRGAKARTTKAKARVEAAQQMMSELADLKLRTAQDRTAAIGFSGTERKTRKLVVAKGVGKSLGGRQLFKDVNLFLSPGMKLGVLGANGSGKTTFLRLLAGQLEPDEGQIVQAEGLRIVMFEQDRATLDRSLTLRQALSPKSDKVVYRDNVIHVSSWARRFLFRIEQLDMPVSQLSGGEQARVLIARLVLQPADLLILDEPTNDLDIPTLEVLEESLEDFPGALVLVTHDRFMLDRLSTDLLGLDGRGGAGLYADFSQWERALASVREKELEEKRPAAAKAAPPAPKPVPAGIKRLTYMEQREWEQIEGKIMEAEGRLEELRKEMEEPGVLSDRARLNECCQKMHEAEETVRKLYARWEALEAKQR